MKDQRQNGGGQWKRRKRKPDENHGTKGWKLWLIEKVGQGLLILMYCLACRGKPPAVKDKREGNM